MIGYPTGRPDRQDPTARPVDPSASTPADWSGLNGRVRDWSDRTTGRVLQLATDYLADRQADHSTATVPTRRGRGWFRRRLDHPTTTEPTAATTPTDRLRFVPPVAALGTAAVLQIVAITDTVGRALATNAAASDVPWLADHPGTGYAAAALLGCAVASCAEGGAAYLMDLYDKHLLARDTVWLLRLAMIGYVAASAGVIHWWTAARGLPPVVSWLLAGMSGSALFLWARGSRWRNRVAMREAGQLDPAMPRLPMAAKLLHPVRWLVTLWLVSWEPVATTDQARVRYRDWSTTRADRGATSAEPTGEPTSPVMVGSTTDQAPRGAVDPTAAVDHPEPTTPTVVEPEPTGTSVDQPTTRPTASRPRANRSGPARPTTPPTVRLVHKPAAAADAAFLRTEYGDQPPGRNELMRRHNGNAGRWSAALRAHADRADQTNPDQTGASA